MHTHTITTASLYANTNTNMAKPMNPMLYNKNLITNNIDSIKKSIIMLYDPCQSEAVLYTPAQITCC